MIHNQVYLFNMVTNLLLHAINTIYQYWMKVEKHYFCINQSFLSGFTYLSDECCLKKYVLFQHGNNQNTEEPLRSEYNSQKKLNECVMFTGIHFI